MWCRLLMKAAVLLAALEGSAVLSHGSERTAEQAPEQSQRPATRPEFHDDERPADATIPANGYPGRNPRVMVILDRSSPHCQRELERLRNPRGAFPGMESKGWKIGTGADNHIQLIERDQVPALLKQLEATEFPVVACISDGEIVRSFKDGCSTPLDAWTFGWLLKGVSERPQAPIPETIRVATTGSYPLRGNHWTVDGDSNPTKETLVSHLRSATHINYLNASWKIEEWSTEELRSLHDDLHERYGPANPTSTTTAVPAGASQFSGARKALGKF